jgi:hypothetical protein
MTVLFALLIVTLSISLLPTSAVFGQMTTNTTVEPTDTGNAGPMTFVDLQNYGHSTGFSIYVPGGGKWVIDSFSDGDGRMQTEQFSAVPAVSPEFEVAATLCEDIAATPGGLASVSPSTGKTYYCGAFGSVGGINEISVRMYQTFGLNPLEYHLSLLDYNTFYNANKRVVNITDTTIDLVDSTTNQTIQEIPAKIANIILLRNDPSSIRLFDYIDTVLYTTDTEITDGYSYVVTFKRDMPGEFDSEDSRARIAATEATAKAIFDSFRIISK